MSQEQLKRIGRMALPVAAAAAGYYALARVGLALALAGTASCPIWPASGFAVVAAVTLGFEAGLGVFLGAWLANLQALPWLPAEIDARAALACAVIALGSAAQALLAARALGARLSAPDTLSRSRDVIYFAVATPLVCLVSASLGLGALLAAGMLEPSLALRSWLTWWIGDTVGVILVAPLLFAWRPRETDELGEPLDPRRALIAVASAAALYATVRLGFGDAFRLGDNYPLSFLPFTALIWITLLLDSRGATLGAAGLAALVLWRTILGSGPFAAGRDLTDSLLLCSVYLGVAAITALLLRALLAERRRAVAALETAQAALERRLSEKSEDLSTANASLRVAAMARREDVQRIQLYREVVDELPVGIAVLRIDAPGAPENWMIVEMNEAGRRMAGAGDADPAGLRLFEFAPEVRYTDLPRACAEALNADRDVEVVDFVSTERVPGGHFAIKVFPLGAPLVGIVFEDVTPQKRALLALRKAQEELESRSAALARSNAELTQFAYVASHDLQAPLRKAAAFAEQLKLRLGGNLDETSRDFIARLGRSLEGMQSLIDALLMLARVATHGEPPRPVELAKVADAVLEDLEESISRSGGRVTLSGLPIVMGDPQQMRQLLQNLLANALKFQRRGEAPVVRVSGRRLDGGLCELRVEDNGVGFDMKYASRLFQPFQRLHSAAEFPGTGMGLAICQKIVERHGGRMAADSVPGRGSVFTVVLPDGRPRAGAEEALESAVS